ncbi:Uncharacterized conserved protein, DUF1800 family [Pseudoxanthomonas sp. GM95]|uniref:DUF1800 domain-containing protein n=1 Tax=Pseudoxanthomonas sp. GM95 TaxID=1881043 RepID=UPI0008D451E1|nr:DUF1800 domain-containing protein [Pseudoxanthomonas sp. GM95]SEL79897.1 Uncharacterized conserved protein, DUF1800 family [Pseudoxanthomonas sp. GM95]
MTRQTAVSATNRFGLGARPDEIAQLGDPQGWLLAQLRDTAQPAPFDSLPTSLDYLQQDIALQQARREAKRDGGDKPKDLAKDLRQGQARELTLRYQVAVASQSSFVERMVRFWSNHFAVSVDKRVAAPYAAPMEREAIRPHVTGNFVDLLLAVETHPAMLRFLDNARSVGADSMAAQRARRRDPDKAPGLNENLAREILELHTVGANGGYSQADVTEFAKAITGWGVPMPQDFKKGTATSAFLFRPNAHEGGARTVMGKRYAEAGLGQGKAVLADLAVHPATARHVSTKIARHLISDTPPQAVVDAMTQAWLKSGGDLATVYTALIRHPAAWDAQARKFKTPDDYLVSALRAGGALGDQRPQALAALLNRMGQPTFTPRSPAGFEDDAAQWSGPDALWKRVQGAQALAEGVPEDVLDPLSTAQAVFGGTLDADTLTALKRAESPRDGLALLFASPAFQWRT